MSVESADVLGLFSVMDRRGSLPDVFSFLEVLRRLQEASKRPFLPVMSGVRHTKSILFYHDRHPLSEGPYGSVYQAQCFWIMDVCPFLVKAADLRITVCAGDHSRDFACLAFKDMPLWISFQGGHMGIHDSCPDLSGWEITEHVKIKQKGEKTDE